MKDIIEAFKNKDKDKVTSSVQAQIDSGRDWLQEHGEWALLVGILGGIVFVLFFKIIVLLVVLGGLASYVIWQLTLENDGAARYLDKGDLSGFADSAHETPVVTVEAVQEHQDMNGHSNNEESSEDNHQAVEPESPEGSAEDKEKDA